MRNEHLDALRGIAILLILGRHRYITDLWQRIGWAGVDLFFVISGFLISGLLFVEFKQNGRIAVGRFWARRGMKIYPQFYTAVAAVSVLYVLFSPRFPVANFVREIVFLQNYRPGLNSLRGVAMLGHTWSLAVEEHFYLLLAIVMLIAMKMSRKRPDPFVWIPYAWIALAATTLCLRLGLRTPDGVIDYYHTYFPTHLRIDSLFFGVVLGYFYHFRRDILRRFSPGFLAIAGGLLLVPTVLIPLRSFSMITFGLISTYVGFGCLVLISVRTPLSTKPWVAFFVHALAKIGFYSYSIYLWHLCVAQWIPMLVLTHLPQSSFWSSVATVTFGPSYRLIYPVGSVLVGVLMAKLVEFPSLRLRDRWFPRSAAAPDIIRANSQAVSAASQ